MERERICTKISKGMESTAVYLLNSVIIAEREEGEEGRGREGKGKERRERNGKNEI